MAVFSSFLSPSGDADIKVSALAATTSSAEQVIGKNRIFAINATQDITIKFGKAGMSAADATFFRIPANQTATFDMGEAFGSLRVFNLGASTADIYIKRFSHN